ncbi:PREDICTED: protein CLP1 homolog [Wasmannia auropunctata]|uniref:protein CLP1 homolog n=1 Tax=Wasmannia auropunctata TaxID=64793 RepID=UPI0005ED6A9C|nr:PREDICTED: protein CLP1 homolog [Wasmannia auropunctata]
MANKKSVVQEFKLDPKCELRFEVENKNEKVRLELKNGRAEVFGTALVRGKKYEFTTGAKVAVYTWQGCTVELVGKVTVSYVAKETPMGLYLNCHAAMERIRETAEKDDSIGPIIMVGGSCDVGKSTLCRILSNYAVRMGRSPIFVDLDVSQGYISIPSTISAFLVERPSNVVEGFSHQASVVFHFGHKLPQANVTLYNLLVTRLAEVCSDLLQVNKKVRASGIVINTCGLVKGDDYKLLTHAVQAFAVDAIFVLDQERLYNELVRDMPDFVEVVFLPKSGGLVERCQARRPEARDQSVREYFYGSPIPFNPYNVEVKWSEVRLYKIGAPVLPASCMPLGMKAEDNLTKLVAITPGPSLLHHMLSISSVNPPEDVVQTNVAGFVCVTNVDVERQTFTTLTVLSPQPRPLPNTVLLLSDIQFMDSH